jgi:ribosomal protein S18 acetylase RimI-like enzyme
VNDLFTSIKQRIKEEPIIELLSYCLFPDPDIIEEEIRRYQENEHMELYGYEEEGTWIAIIGFMMASDTLVIKHISVDPGYRGLGYGRGLLLEVLELKKPSLMIAETEEEAVDFFRNVGFMISSLGQAYPAMERFRCEYNALMTPGDS